MAINPFKDYSGFTAHIEVTDTSVAPFETYLYIDYDNGFTREAYALSDECPLDIDFLVKQAFKDEADVETCPQMGGPNYAAIITDGRAPNAGIVWASRDFYFVEA